MDSPISRHRSRNSGVVISRALGFRFFRLNVRHQSRAPELKNLREHLVDAEHIEFIEPLLDGAGNGGIGVESHDVGHVFEDLQILDLQFLAVIGFALIGGFQLGRILEDVPFELDAVKPRNSGGGTEPNLLAADQDGFLKHRSARLPSGQFRMEELYVPA